MRKRWPLLWPWHDENYQTAVEMLMDRSCPPTMWSIWDAYKRTLRYMLNVFKLWVWPLTLIGCKRNWLQIWHIGTISATWSLKIPLTFEQIDSINCHRSGKHSGSQAHRMKLSAKRAQAGYSCNDTSQHARALKCFLGNSQSEETKDCKGAISLNEKKPRPKDDGCSFRCTTKGHRVVSRHHDIERQAYYCHMQPSLPEVRPEQR